MNAVEIRILLRGSLNAAFRGETFEMKLRSTSQSPLRAPDLRGFIAFDFSEGFLLLPLEGRFFNLESSELGRGLADSFFYGDALHAGCAHKAVDGRPFEDLLHIRGRGDGAAVAEHENIVVNRSSGFRDFLGLLCSLLQAHRFLCSYSATDGQPHMGQDTIATRLGHLTSLFRIEDVGRREEIHLMGQSDHLDFLVVAHACFLKGGSELTVDHSNGRKVVDAGETRFSDLPEKRLHHFCGSVPLMEQMTGPLSRWENVLFPQLQRDVVCVPIGHPA